jgi:hypothetical protein
VPLARFAGVDAGDDSEFRATLKNSGKIGLDLVPDGLARGLLIVAAMIFGSAANRLSAVEIRDRSA